MLNPAIDIQAAARDLAQRGRTRIAELLQPQAAEAIAHCMEREVRWTLAIRTDGESKTIAADAYAAMDGNERQSLLNAAAALAHEGFSFAYDSYQMVTAYLARRDPGLLLHRIVELLNSPQFLQLAVRLTGDQRIRKADCQATCYRQGHFLTAHDDRYEDEGRLYAYVLGLTRDWRADWGGLLHFIDAHGDVSQTLVPRYNSLTIFRVPQFHCVSMVTPWAGAGRYSITGWLRSS